VNPYRYAKCPKAHSGRPNEAVELLHSSRVRLAARQLQSRRRDGMTFNSKFEKRSVLDIFARGIVAVTKNLPLLRIGSKMVSRV
jgi:hypothetical protein